MKKRAQRPVEIYSDGSVDLHKKFGGYGIIMLFGSKVKKIKSNGYHSTTIARMELKAIIHALEQIKPGFDIYLYSDNKATIDAINKKLEKWLISGDFENKKNWGLWSKFVSIRDKHLEGGSYISFSWVRGHAGNKYNEISDKLASEASRSRNKIKCLDDN